VPHPNPNPNPNPSREGHPAAQAPPVPASHQSGLHSARGCVAGQSAVCWNKSIAELMYHSNREGILRSYVPLNKDCGEPTKRVKGFRVRFE
jgi:hypothetical protein